MINLAEDIPTSQLQFTKVNEAVLRGSWAPYTTLKIQKLDMAEGDWSNIGTVSTNQQGQFKQDFSFQKSGRGLYAIRLIDSSGDHESRTIFVNAKEGHEQPPVAGSVNAGAFPDTNYTPPQTVHTPIGHGIDTALAQSQAKHISVWNPQTNDFELKSVNLVREPLQGKPVYDQSQYPNVSSLPPDPLSLALMLVRALSPAGMKQTEVPLFFPGPDSPQQPTNTSPEVPLFMPKPSPKKPASEGDSYAV